MKLYKGISISLVLLSTCISGQTANWMLKYNRDSIKVYYRKSPVSNIHEMRLTTKVESSLSSLVTLVDDVESYTRWVFKTIKASDVKIISETEKYYYILSDFPWPLNDRDYIAHTKLEQDVKTKIVTSTSASSPKMVPLIKNVIRIELTKTKWIFTPINKNEVLIEYTLLADPGGSLPDWAVNLALDKGPYETMQKFIKLLKEDKYRNVKVPYIQEF